MTRNKFTCSAFGVPVSGGATGTIVTIGTPTPGAVSNTSDATYTNFVTVSDLEPSTAYRIVVDGLWSTDLATTGPDFGITGTVAPASLAVNFLAARTATGGVFGNVTAYGSVAVSASGTTTTEEFVYIVDITTGASATNVSFRVKVFAGDVGTVTIAAGVKSHWFKTS